MPGAVVKVWNGSAWVAKPLKVWNGSAWVVKPVKIWNGSAWQFTSGGGPTNAKTSTFIDALDSFNATNWTASGTTGTSLSRFYATAQNPGLSGQISNAYYDLTGSSAYVKVDAPAGITSRETVFSLLDVSGNGLSCRITGTTRSLVLRAVVSGSANDTSVTYDPVAHAWLRLSMSGTTASWDGSPDGVIWTNIRTLTIGSGFDPTAVKVAMSCANVSTEADAQTAYFDYLNTASTAPFVAGVIGSSQSSPATSMTFTMPTGLVAGDLVVIMASTPDSAANAAITPSTTGWTVATAIADQGGSQRALYYATWSSGLTAPSWSLSVARKTGYLCVAVRNPTGTPVINSNVAGGLTQNAPVTTSLRANSLVLRMYYRKDTTSTICTPQLDLSLVGLIFGTGAGAISSAAYVTPQVSAGACPAEVITWNVTSTNSVAWSIGI